MGNFRLEINAVGGHGCARTTRKVERERSTSDQPVELVDRYFGCNNLFCVDCKFREFVRELKRIGVDVKSASETHWPGEPSEVVDDVLNQVRIKGAF